MPGCNQVEKHAAQQQDADELGGGQAPQEAPVIVPPEVFQEEAAYAVDPQVKGQQPVFTPAPAKQGK